MPTAPAKTRSEVTAGCPQVLPPVSRSQMRRPVPASNAKSFAASEEPTYTEPSRIVAGDSTQENQ
ncbi:MAG TPA: hypothetical protein VII08_17965 [Myxococcales bacterium]